MLRVVRRSSGAARSLLRSTHLAVVWQGQEACVRELLPFGCRALSAQSHTLEESQSQPSAEIRPRPLTASRLGRAYLQLSKSKLTAFVTITATLGFLTAGPPISVPALLGVTIGTSLCSASASACNQIYEVTNDSLMSRTRARPLPSGKLSKTHAALFAAATGAAGVSLLAVACNPLTAALGAANIALYAAVYTPLKQHSYLNTEVGAIVGAVPPLMGWTACTGSITADLAGVALFTALFLWQMPHFYALAWRHRADYERGGYQMVSLGDQGGGRTARRTMAYSVALAAFPLVTTMAGVTGSMFLLEGALFNALFLRKAWQFYKDPSDSTARGVFFASLWYLPLILFFLAFHSHRWRAVTDDQDAVRLSRQVPEIDAGLVAGTYSQQLAGSAAMWLRDVDMKLASSFADDPASRWISGALGCGAARVRRMLRAHCPHEIADHGSTLDSAGLPAKACPVTHQRAAATLTDASQDGLSCPVPKQAVVSSES
jgi:heme o synthase